MGSEDKINWTPILKNNGEEIIVDIDTIIDMNDNYELVVKYNYVKLQLC